jgi:hypothetical protein
VADAGAILQHHDQNIARAHSPNCALGTVVTVERRQPEAPGMQNRKATNTLVDDTCPPRGHYGIASLVPGQQRSGMWDVLEITRSGLPRVTLLRPVP